MIRFLVVVPVRMTRRRHLRQVVVLLVFAESGQGQGQAEIVGLVVATAAARVVVIVILIIIMQRRPPFPFRLGAFRGGVLVVVVSVLDSQVGQRIQVRTELSPLFDRRRRDESRIVLCDLGKRFEPVRAEWSQPSRGGGAAR